MERPRLLKDGSPRLSDEELIRQIREMNKSPLCIVPLEENVNRVVLRIGSFYLGQLLESMTSNGYKVTVERATEDEYVLTWKDKESR